MNRIPTISLACGFRYILNAFVPRIYAVMMMISIPSHRLFITHILSLTNIILHSYSILLAI